MYTPLDATHPPLLMRRPTLRTIVIIALLVNALLWGFAAVPSAPPQHNLPHMLISLVVAGIVALPFRWGPLVGALLCAGQFVEGLIFLDPILAEVDSAAELIFAGLFFASQVVGLVASVTATVQNYRAPRSRPLVDPPAPRWTYPVIVSLTVLVLSGILVTAIQAPDVVPSVSPETLAALPALTSKDYQFGPSEIRAKVGETVVLRLDNADTSTHYLDIDEFNVHALMPMGKSTLVLFKPTQPGTYTFYCRPHANKETGEGMVGRLIVEP